MARKSKEILRELESGFEAYTKAYPKRGQFMSSLHDTCVVPGPLDKKTVHLIAVALGICRMCEYCIATHTKEAFEAGATREELVQAGFIAMGMTGGPGVAYNVTYFLNAVNEFAPEYGK